MTFRLFALSLPLRGPAPQVSLCQLPVSLGQSSMALPVHTLPAIHALHLVQLLERWNITPSELLNGFELSLDVLADPSARLSVATIEQLIARARELTAEPGLGLYMGLQMKISAHGYIGFAAMTASTVRESLEIAERFIPTRTNAIGIRLEVEGSTASVIVEERCSLGTARDVIIFALMIGLWRIGASLTGRELGGSAEFAFAEPSYFPRFAELYAGSIRFSAPRHRLIFDAALLGVPLVMSDPAALQLAREQCQKELDALGYDNGVVSRVRALIPKSDGGVRSLSEIADSIHMSHRTLKRKLGEQGTAYSDLLDEHRKTEASKLLRSELSIEQIAERLGYSDAANFTRAFRRWTGKTPKAYRRS